MATVNDVLNVARNWIGVSEANGRHMEIVNVYNSHTPLARGYKLQRNDAWCDGFVSACAILANAVDIIGTEVGCENHISIFKAKGIWIEDGTITPIPGDVILFNWDDNTQPNDGGADHIGFVECVNGNTITCIEGNKSDAVGRRDIPIGWGYIRGYARPKYSESADKIVTTEKETVNNKPTIVIIDGKLKVDGLWGPSTTTRAQEVFGTEVDGKVSNQDSKYKSVNPGLLSTSFEWRNNPTGYSPLIKAIQKRVGVDQDGHVGPMTIKAMQKWLGTYIDGKVDKPSDMVRAFQTWLNEQ